jgi:hypothetical protein
MLHAQGKTTVLVDLDARLTDAWREAFPEAHVGLLALEHVINPPHHAELELLVRDLETRLRERFAGADRTTLTALPVIHAYVRHYRAFGQNYHVLRQLESVALKGKSLASPSALVLAMFAAELESPQTGTARTSGGAGCQRWAPDGTGYTRLN